MNQSKTTCQSGQVLKSLLLPFFLLFSLFQSNAQDPHRFDEDIKKFNSIVVDDEKEVAVFTGSSSVRMWTQVHEDCSTLHAINTGFGGSHMSDLLYFLDEAVLRFQPSRVYIYEGDNDIAAQKTAKEIIETTKELTTRLLTSNPKMQIYFISAKPSPSRWKYKDQYLEFNSMLNAYCATHEQLTYVDVWTGMLAKNGRPNPSIFIADSLHMNREGYLIWKEIICPNIK